jgi:aspartyl-tRNA(Asn)/glutamyl-tRNA(Gln) amidotransferase subunit A
VSRVDLGSLDPDVLGRGLRDRRWTVEQITRASLERIEAAQPVLNAFVEHADTRAVEWSARLDEELARGYDRGPLHGIPVAVKDNVAVAGTVMRAGSALEWPSATDAGIVTLLLSAGAVVVGRTRLHELAMGATGVNAHDGGARNPQDADRIPGGSSSGSAVAVAAGLCSVAIGTDSLGSVRIPAAFCGVVGFKPTFGVLPTDGVLPVSKHLDHIGLLGRRVADVSIAFRAVAPGSRAHAGPLGRRVGIVTTGLDGAESAVAEAFEHSTRLLERAGATLAEVRLASEDDVSRAAFTIVQRENYQVHATQFESDASVFGADIRERMADNARVSLQEYDEALRLRELVRRDVAELFEGFDLIVSPTVPIVAPFLAEIGRHSVPGMLSRNTRSHDLVGIPAISVPIPGLAPSVGFHIAAAAGRDAYLLDAARAFETLLAST